MSTSIKFPDFIWIVRCGLDWTLYTDLDEAIEEADSEGSMVAEYKFGSAGVPKITRSLE